MQFLFLPYFSVLQFSAFATLKHDVRMIAVTEHRARALSEMLGVTSNSGIVHHQEKQGTSLCYFFFPLCPPFASPIRCARSDFNCVIQTAFRPICFVFLLAKFLLSVLLAESDPVELRVDCYECILTCMNNVYAQHHRLMLVLMVRISQMCLVGVVMPLYYDVQLC